MENFTDPIQQGFSEKLNLSQERAEGANREMTDEEWATKMIEAGISPEEIKTRIEARNKDRA